MAGAGPFGRNGEQLEASRGLDMMDKDSKSFDRRAERNHGLRDDGCAAECTVHSHWGAVAQYSTVHDASGPADRTPGQESVGISRKVHLGVLYCVDEHINLMSDAVDLACVRQDGCAAILHA